MTWHRFYSEFIHNLLEFREKHSTPSLKPPITFAISFTVFSFYPFTGPSSIDITPFSHNSTAIRNVFFLRMQYILPASVQERCLITEKAPKKKAEYH